MRKRFRVKLAGLAAMPLVFALAAEAEARNEPEEGFVALFNGRDFTGWEGNLDHFRIEDGAIVGGSMDRGIAHNEFLCTPRAYADFELRLEAKTIGNGTNGGIQIRSRRVPGATEVSGYQADLAIQPTRNVWGALYDESRRRVMLALPDQGALAEVYKPEEWNGYTIRCEGRRIRLWINGHQTVDYSEPDPNIPLEGIIGLQIHSGPPGEAWYRHIRIKEIPVPAPSE